MFGERTARRDLKRYRRKGPSRATRLLVDALRSAGVEGARVLDIGGGVGAVQHELLDAGAAHATGVDAAPAYVLAAREEAERRGHAGRVSQLEGDFVALADRVEPADVVTLDRVICCYPDMPALVGRSADRAERLYALVYPRDVWWTRLAFRGVNVAFRVARNPFRVYVHHADAVDATLRERGLAPTVERRAGPVWKLALYERVRTRPAPAATAPAS